MEELSKPAESAEKSAAAAPPPANQASKHHPILVKMISDQLSVKADQLLDFELCLADAAPAGI